MVVSRLIHIREERAVLCPGGASTAQVVAFMTTDKNTRFNYVLAKKRRSIQTRDAWERNAVQEALDCSLRVSAESSFGKW